MEDSTALHFQRRAWMVREDEDWHVVRRIRAPPALPLMVRPRPAHRPEHVAAHDPGAQILERAGREVVVDARRPAVSPQDLTLKDARRTKPLVQLFTAAAERMITVLGRAGAEAVCRHAEGVHAKLGHGRLLDCRCIDLLNRDVTPASSFTACGLERPAQEPIRETVVCSRETAVRLARSEWRRRHVRPME